MKFIHVLVAGTSCLWLSTSEAVPLRESAVHGKQVNVVSDAFTVRASVQEQIRSSFQIGSAQNLATYFDRQLELIIDTEEVAFQEVRAKHAELILNAFFRKYPPRHFQYVYQGGSPRLQYITGKYQSAGQRFQVYVLMRQDAHHHLVINTLHLRKS